MRQCVTSTDPLAWPSWPSFTAIRLFVTVAAHVGESKGWALLQKCLCSVRLYHPHARTLLADNASPQRYAAQLRALSRQMDGRILHCRSEVSSWSFGVLRHGSQLVA